MAAKTGKKPKPEPEVAAANKGKTKSAPPAGQEIVTVKASAMSTQIGPVVIAGLAAAYSDEKKANDILAGVEKKRYDLLAQTTQGVLKAAMNDDSIDLTAAFKDDKKAMNKLNDQLGIALGFREVYETEVNGEIRKKIGTAKAVVKFFPSAKDKKGDPATQQKATIRSNFLHLLKKCVQTASGIMADGKIDVKQDKDSGTLLLSGPTIAKKFGADSVLLNEKLTVGEGDDKKKLKEKPSFTAIAKLGAEAAGKVLKKREDSRVNQSVDPNTAVVSICNTLVSAIGKLTDKPDPKAIEALKNVQSAIVNKLKA